MKIDLKSVVELIVSTQKISGEIPWYVGGKTDPWDHTESAMGLAIGGRFDEAIRAFEWLKSLQMEDGSWYSSYINGIPSDKTRETNMSAYVAVGVFHYWLITSDRNFLESMWETVYRAINFVLAHQGSNGEIYWAISPDGEIDRMALLASSSSVFMSLKCAMAISQELRIKTPSWEEALRKLKNAILYKTHVFNASKARFSMDWFYPILSGAVSGVFAFNRVSKYWDKFVVKNLGVRCVSDQPWVTIAESSELVLSLTAVDNMILARSVFEWIAERIFQDGSFWCGFTFPDMKLWPEEKISWTNAALLMAVDALYGLTPASSIFNHNWWKTRYGIC